MTPLKNIFSKLLSKNRRRAERMAAPRLAAYYWTNAAPTEHSIRDISSTGLYLLTEERWYPGTMVMMTLQKRDEPEDSPNRSITVQSKAVRWGTDGVGLQFVLPNVRDAEKMKLGADRKTLEKFLDGFVSESGSATVDFVVRPPDSFDKK